jgi:NhaA family Na+:H+ antiporter
MSLFIGSLAFEQGSEGLIYQDRLGIVIGSLVSGVLGYWVINKSVKSLPSNKPSKTTEAKLETP